MFRASESLRGGTGWAKGSAPTPTRVGGAPTGGGGAAVTRGMVMAAFMSLRMGTAGGSVGYSLGAAVPPPKAASIVLLVLGWARGGGICGGGAAGVPEGKPPLATGAPGMNELPNPPPKASATHNNTQSQYMYIRAR